MLQRSLGCRPLHPPLQHTLLFWHKLKGVRVYSEAGGAVGGSVPEELVAEGMTAGPAQQLEGVGVVGLWQPLHGVLTNRLAEGGPGRGVLVLRLAGEQRLLAGRAHVCAW